MPLRSHGFKTRPFVITFFSTLLIRKSVIEKVDHTRNYGNRDFLTLVRVLHQCALEYDLQLFEAGDLTEVGERGLTLRSVTIGLDYTF